MIFLCDLCEDPRWPSAKLRSLFSFFGTTLNSKNFAVVPKKEKRLLNCASLCWHSGSLVVDYCYVERSATAGLAGTGASSLSTTSVIQASDHTFSAVSIMSRMV